MAKTEQDHKITSNSSTPGESVQLSQKPPLIRKHVYLTVCRFALVSIKMAFSDSSNYCAVAQLFSVIYQRSA